MNFVEFMVHTWNKVGNQQRRIVWTILTGEEVRHLFDLVVAYQVWLSLPHSYRSTPSQQQQEESDDEVQVGARILQSPCLCDEYPTLFCWAQNLHYPLKECSGVIEMWFVFKSWNQKGCRPPSKQLKYKSLNGGRLNLRLTRTQPCS